MAIKHIHLAQARKIPSLAEGVKRMDNTGAEILRLERVIIHRKKSMIPAGVDRIRPVWQQIALALIPSLVLAVIIIQFVFSF